jgi:acyl-CoA thioesterase FadM
MPSTGHVNNVVYLTYMESARIAWWVRVTGRLDFRDGSR